jgi:hypothetical protein
VALTSAVQLAQARQWRALLDGGPLIECGQQTSKLLNIELCMIAAPSMLTLTRWYALSSARSEHVPNSVANGLRLSMLFNPLCISLHLQNNGENPTQLERFFPVKPFSYRPTDLSR